MRLRRLEFVIIGVTLAFVCFLGGFFTGRSWSAVNIVSVEAPVVETNRTDEVAQPPGTPAQSTPALTQNPQGNTDHETSNEPAVTPGSGMPREGDGRININLASQSELTDLPGIGNVLASRIVDYRRQHGDFKRIEDIRNVTGIGEKRFEAIQDKITVG